LNCHNDNISLRARDTYIYWATPTLNHPERPGILVLLYYILFYILEYNFIKLDSAHEALGSLFEKLLSNFFSIFRAYRFFYHLWMLRDLRFVFISILLIARNTFLIPRKYKK
jgi:hypothetical protein